MDTSGSGLHSVNRGKQSGSADLSYHFSHDFLRLDFLFPKSILSLPKRLSVKLY